jgi:hypothetical protein
MSSGKFARTMAEAFGPYTTRQLSPMPEPHHPNDVIVMLGCVAALIALVVVLL